MNNVHLLTYGKIDERCSSVSVPTLVGRKTELTYGKIYEQLKFQLLLKLIVKRNLP
jgi:hypothetical protein